MDARKEPKPSPVNEIERLQALLRAKDDHLDKLKAEKTLMCGSCIIEESGHSTHWTIPYLHLKTKQSLTQISSKCVSDFEQEFDKQNWRNMFNSSADYVFSIEERLRQLANRSGQFRSWAEFQTLSNKLELFLRVAQQHHRVMKKAIDEYGREMLKILQTLDVMIFADTNNENVMVFAPDQILKDVAAAGEGNSSGAASSKIAIGSDISVKEHGDVKTWRGIRWVSQLTGNPPSKTTAQLTSRERFEVSDQNANMNDDVVFCGMVPAKTTRSNTPSASKEGPTQPFVCRVLCSASNATPVTNFEGVTPKRLRIEATGFTQTPPSGSVTPQNGLAVPSLGFCATSLGAETETIRTANILPPPVAPATAVFTPPTETPSIPFCGNGPTMPLLTPPATPENFVAARNVLLPAHFDMRLPLYARVWSAASALSNFLHIPLPPCPPNELNAVSLPANTTTVGESLLPPVQSRKHGMLPPLTPPESQLLLSLKTPSIKGRRSARVLKKFAPAARQGSATTVSAAETTNKEVADIVNVLVGKPLTMSSTMNAEPASADVLPPVGK
uniref:Reverse transcriptase domain-containing protein n=1 Tax=Haemonchus contortus TaxID=6289 RepID=A0A7I5E8N0_HAECO